ncbi:MAG: phosphatidylglycerophosphatase A [Chromatiaceae bacterium]|nr:phosphatidylglycerophosphatase A [Chromatiaceae bacterium]
MPERTFDPRRPHHWLAFGLGSGLAPRAPGTVGTLAAVPLYLLMTPLPLWAYLALVALAFALGIWVCGRTSADLGAEDPSAIVWDEFVGFWVAMLGAPSGWLGVVAGFALFRLFDIWKPWPICAIERRLGGGLGIMLDDVVAGLLAALTMLLIGGLTTLL